MAIIQCSECNKEISDQAKICPHCGYKKNKPKLWLWIPLVVVTVVLLYGNQVANTPEGKARSRARVTIDLCHEEERKKPGNTIASGACRTLENDFRNKFGMNP